MFFSYKNLVITAEGNVLPCCTFYGDEMPLGNIYKLSSEIRKNGILEYFWNHPKMISLRKLHKNFNYAKNPLCKKCVEGSLLTEN